MDTGGAGAHSCVDRLAGPALSHSTGLSGDDPPGVIDRWEGDAGAVAAALPPALIGVDRFQVAIHSREAVDDRRKQEYRRLNAGRPADQALPTAELRRWRRQEGSSLTPAQQGPLLDWFEQTSPLVSAYLLRPPLTAIVEYPPDRATAPTRRRRWGEPVKAAGLTGFDNFLNTLHHWQDGILNSFEGRHPSGFVEGFNTKPKRLKRRCFGLDDPVERFRRLWLEIEGPRLWA